MYIYIYVYLYNKDERLSVCLSVCVSVCYFIDGKARASTYKQKVHSYVKFSEENNGSSPNSLSAPVKEWRAI